MNTTEILTKIKTLLSTDEVKLASQKLDDGITIIESENFEAGDEISIVSEDGKVALPVGEYTTEEGKMIIVKEEGVIFDVKEVTEEEVKEEEAAPEVEEEVEASTEPAAPKKIVESVSKESYFSEIEKLKAEIETLKAEKEELSKVEETTEEVKEETTEVELSTEEEVTPITHNPEAKEEVKLGKTISPSRQRNILDSVFSKIANK